MRRESLDRRREMKHWPDTIRVLCARYDVLYRAMVAEDGKHLHGQARHGRREIEIGTETSGGKRRDGAEVFETIMHELLHVVINEATLLSSSIRDDVEEAFVCTLSSVLSRALLDAGIVELPPEGVKA